MFRKPTSKKIIFGVIGYGRFGRLWARELSRHGRVVVYDTRKAHMNRAPRGIRFAKLSEVAMSDFLFLAVPAFRLEECCKRIRTLLQPTTMVLDTCSIKVWPVAVMKKFLPKGQAILGTHPLFGPDSARMNGGIRGFKVVVCRVRGDTAREREIVRVFKGLSLKVIISTPAEHDRAMARSQALVHFAGRALGAFKLKEQEISTPDYETLLRMQNMVVNDTWQLFSDMQEKNPFASKIRERFVESLERLDADISVRSDPQSLRAGIERIDREILTLLASRMTLSRAIGKLKKAKGLPVRNRTREGALEAMRLKRAKELGLDSAFVKKIFTNVVAHSRNLQRSQS